MNRPRLLATASRLIEADRMRREVFGAAADGMGDPCWQMLLHLYVASDAGARPVQAVELHRASGTGAESSALYLRFLSSHRMVVIRLEGHAGPVVLADEGVRAMNAYLERVE